MHNLFQVNTNNQDDQRVGKITLYILTGLISLSTIALSVISISYFRFLLDSSHNYNDGGSILQIIFVDLLFMLMFSLVRKGYVNFIAPILVLMNLLISTFVAYKWGIDVPQSLLMFSLSVILSGVLLKSKQIIAVILYIALTQLILTYTQVEGITQVNSYWKTGEVNFIDTLVTTITLLIIALIAWIANKEINKSLQRAYASERALRKERDLLEIRVQERTDALKKAQLEKILNLYRFADFGKLASGLMHEIINPLTAVSLNLEALDEQSHNKEDFTKALDRARASTKRIEDYVKAARKQIQKQKTHVIFNICEELESVIKIYSYRARQSHVSITLTCKSNLEYEGDNIKFCQCISNLLANSLDALETSNTQHKEITLSVAQKSKTISITCTDNGPGIPKELHTDIFEPFFTTKDSKRGTGIGLAMTKDIVTKEFGGSIKVLKSKKGTHIEIKLPLSQ